jgi:hypothetical protein
MSEPSEHRAQRFRWDQVLVLAVVVVAADYIGFRWLMRDQQAPVAARSLVPDDSVLDEEMGRKVRLAALQAGVNPNELPDLPQLWTEMLRVAPGARRVETGDRQLVQRALEAYVRSLASGEPTASPSGMPGQGLTEPDAASRKPGAVKRSPSIARLDELKSHRLTKLAQQHGIDPAVVMPPATRLLQAYLASLLALDASSSL